MQECQEHRHAKTAPARAQVVRHSPRKRCRPEGRKRNRTCDFPVVRTRAGTEVRDRRAEGQGVSPGARRPTPNKAEAVPFGTASHPAPEGDGGVTDI